ncbi:MAG: hypothetical protein M0019_02040 [Actinomycetota bacterium]|nr:hypothetical protein [Actinomycetota bacterium]
MKLKTLRTLVGATSVIAITGMIVSAILNHIGSVIAFGTFGAVAIVVMITSTTTVRTSMQSQASEDSAGSGEDLELEVSRLTSQYPVPEAEVRELIRRSVALARKNK